MGLFKQTGALGMASASTQQEARNFTVSLWDLDDTLYRQEEVPKLVTKKIKREKLTYLARGACLPMPHALACLPMC